MHSDFGGNSVYTPLKRVIMRSPGSDFSEADISEWNYTSKPDLKKASAEHNAIINILKNEGVEVLMHDVDMPGKADSIYVFDPVYMTDYGAIILKPGKKLREGEETGMKIFLEKHDIPIFLELTGNAKAEGGDMLWIDEKTLAIGIGFRTNKEAVIQIKSALSPKGIEVIGFDLPYFSGPQACLHLLSFISIVDKDLAVIYPKLMPVALYQLLLSKGFDFIHVPEDEFATMGTNVLAISPRVCLIIENNINTIEQLKSKNCRVITYKGDDISLKSEGGPTCLTRPILRAY